MNQEEIQSLNRTLSSKCIKSVIKSFSTKKKKLWDQMASLMNSLLVFNKNQQLTQSALIILAKFILGSNIHLYFN